ncbi:MAG: protein kinase [Anaerolineales bacterium]
MSGTNQVTELNSRYELGEELGRGGMGTVYRAHDPTLDRDVAIKVLSDANLGTESRGRLLREAQSVAKLSHPNIVPVFDAGESDEYPFIVMELIEGQSLHDRPPKDLEETIRIAIQVCAALEHAHNQGIVHRDLKPENVLIDADGTAKLMDFGIARSMASRLTSEGTVVGTVFYLAPEVALGHEYDGRADLYSLGVMLYELTTGSLPYADGDPVAVISQHIHASVVPPRGKNPDVPPLLDTLIVQLMSKDPDDRPSSAAEASQLLNREALPDPEAKDERGVLVLDRIVRGRFVGREQELSEARSLWSKAAGGEGQTLLISGEPGIGKTRLMRELSTHVELTGGRVMAGACYAEGSAPYAPFAHIMRTELGNGSGNGFEIPDFVLADLLDLTPDLKPYYADIPENPQLEPEAEQLRLFENVVTFCGTLADAEPLMLVLDDAHWADSSSSALFRHLARRIPQKPILLVGTYREVEIDSARPFREVLFDLNRERLGRRLKLGRLSLDQTEALLAAIFQEEITPEFLDGIFRETEGNPFFIEEVCKALIEEGQVFYTEDGWDRLSMEEMEIPQSVRDTVDARSSKLPDEYQEALTLAAIIGREFDFVVLARASDLDETTLIDALEAAEDAQLIEEVRGASGATFSFVHALIAATLVEGVRTLRRRGLHQRVAEAIESLRPEAFEDLAHHYEEAGDGDRAREFYVRAGERAAAVYTNQEAEDHFRAALDLEPDETQRAELFSKLAEVIARVGRHDEAIETWKEAAELFSNLDEVDREAWCYANMARSSWWAGDQAAALKLCTEGLERVGDSHESPELANLLHETGRTLFFLGDTAEADPLLRRALEMARRVSDRRVEADTLVTLGATPFLSVDESIAALKEAIDIAREAELPKIESRAHNNLGVTLFDGKADLRSSLEHYLKAVEIDRRRGNLTGELFTYSNAASVTTHLGELASAEKMISHLRELNERLVDSGEAGRAYRARVTRLQHAWGEFRVAAELGQELVKESSGAGNLPAELDESVWLGIALRGIGQYAEGVRLLEETVTGADQLGLFRVWARAHLAISQAVAGNAAQARQVYDEGREIFKQRPRAWSGIHLDWAYAQVIAVEGQWNEAWPAFDVAATGFEWAGARWLRANVLRDWAQAHVKCGEPADLERARELLREAQAEHESMGAPGYVDLIQSQLSELDDSSS